MSYQMTDGELRDILRISASDGCEIRVKAERTGSLNRRWARNVRNNHPHGSGSFVYEIAGAYLMADDDNEEILNGVMTRLREKYPTWDVEEGVGYEG